MPKSIVITEEMANRMFDVAVKHCGANERSREMFVGYATRQELVHQGCSRGEFRFGGSLDSGGKIYFDRFAWYGGYYFEHKTKERDEMVKQANAALQELRKSI